VNRGDAEEHENNGLGRAAQHLERVLKRRLRLRRYVALDVVFHSDATEGNAGKKGWTKNVKKVLVWFHLENPFISPLFFLTNGGGKIVKFQM
jgi:arginine utilization protein RocB